MHLNCHTAYPRLAVKYFREHFHDKKKHFAKLYF